MAEVDFESEIGSNIKTAMSPPGKYHVVLYNDDKTTVEFVILILMSIFHKDLTEANELTMHIHEHGKGIVGTYSHEVASQKRNETVHAARSNQFPLRCEIEKSQ